MVESVTITRISSTGTKADGTKLTGKYGDYYRIGIQIEERLTAEGDPIWINGFQNRNPDWVVGDKLDVEITEVEYKGEMQLRFRTPKGGDVLESRVKRLEDEVFKDQLESTANEADKGF